MASKAYQLSVSATVKRSLQLGRLGVDVFMSTRRATGPGREASRRLVARRMGRMRGLPQKIGQILSLSEFDSEAPLYAALTDAGEPAPADQSFAWIARELGTSIEHVFRRLDTHAAAASLGQVHRGELVDGRAVAVKVQYPGVASSLDADLRALGWLAAPLSTRRSGFNLDAYRDEMRRTLLRELDYHAEAEALRRFAGRASEVRGLVTPVPVDEWCTAKLLTMSWVDGDRVEATRAWPAPARAAAGLVLLRSFLRGAFVWRELHADPHAGNLRFRMDGSTVRVGLLDFGCVKVLDERASDALRLLAEDAPEMDDAEIVDAYLALGFDERLLEPLRNRLRAVTQVLFEPLHTRGPFDLRSWDVSTRLAAVLGDDRWNFRYAGPASLLFFIRAFQGLIQYLRTLDAAIDWRQELVALPRAPRAVVPAASDPAVSLPSLKGLNSMTATTLRLRVIRDGQQLVQLSFKASAVGHLEDLVPEDLGERIRHRGINLTHLASRAVAEGYPVGDLFTLTESDRTVRVWLE